MPYLTHFSRVFALLVLLCVLLPACDLLGGEDPSGEIDLRGKLVFASKTTGEYQLYVMNADGTDRQQLTVPGSEAEENSAVQPTWSSSGQRIAFSTYYRSTTAGPSLYLMDTNGSAMRPLKRYESDAAPALVGEHPTWSPDDRRIAYDVCMNCELGGRNREIFIVDVEGEMYDPDGHFALTDHPSSDRLPAWSPDGGQIAFVSNRAYLTTDDYRRRDLYVVNADGSHLRRLTKTGNVGAIAWNPDGETIAYTLNEPGSQLFLVDISDGNVASLNVPLPDGWKLFPTAWSPDGQRLLLSALDYPAYSLHILDVETRKTRRIPFGPEQLLGVDWFPEAKIR